MKYLHGLNHWPTPTSYRHLARDQWKAKPTRNYLYQVYDFKKAIVLDATPTVTAEPLEDMLPTVVLEDAKNVVQHELTRLRWDRMRSKMFFDGYVIGKGITHVYSEKDPFSGEMKLCLERVDPRRFYADPNADCLEEAQFVVYEPSLTLSKIKTIFPEKGPLVKPKGDPSYGRLTVTSTRQRGYDEILYGPTGETLVDKDGKLSERKADVCFVWVKDGGLSEDTRNVVMRDPAIAWRCPACGMLSDTSEMGCPECGTMPQEMAPEEIPEETKQETVVSRKYPFGRLIVYSGEVLLYDGASPWQLEGTFPFAEFEYYSSPGEFWAFGDVQLLKSCQMVADKNAAMLLDAQRLTSFGHLEYPIGAEGYANRSNAPGTDIPVPADLSGMARWLTPQGYNAQLHQLLDEMTHRDIQITSGISDVSAGLAPTAPTSGVEVKARQRAASTRIGQHLKNMSRYSSDLANIVFQMMRQLYVGPRPFLFTNEMSETQAISLDVSQLPPGISIRVSADPDDIEKDNLQGQNVLGFATTVLANPMLTAALAPYVDIILPAMGIKPQKAKELQKRMLTQMMLQPMAPALGNGAMPGAPPPGTSKPGEPGPSAPNQEAAYASLGA